MGFKRYDAFSKSSTGTSVQTVEGAALSISAFIFMLVLAVLELYSFFQVSVVEQIVLDNDFGTAQTNFSLDIDFVALKCDQVHVILEQTLKKEHQEVTSMFSLSGTSGCNVKGTIPIPKDSGSLSVAYMHPTSKSTLRLLKDLSDMFSFDTSHKINSLSFGSYFPGINNPLDDFTYNLATESSASRVWYQIKVVPTIYRSIDGSRIQSNQFSVSQYTKTFKRTKVTASTFSSGQVHIPGVYLQYDFSPIVIEKSETKKTLPQLITRLFALLGGTYAFAGLLDAFIYHSIRVKKID
mmetsp:Transcript_16129/g.18279  ORF Transcript_16129/g.18279 Transcript_16129/m.18279 type:complete len:295 (+) Transcript_16129:182-1066(+)|eukprot:CAMPEP_0184023874 /NCGR_PEP_ID=MMETSP0954-20121128/11667_1 /TAXON_ID=627963 /ORGANISM="Aplanochytrium sp, Strain PBS07" /LENGTH=294 /DNA_ID=CAMNT_0026306935 /DNA_START=174 /DNA_END=1058 /DNA_ORIENTATION=+